MLNEAEILAIAAIIGATPADIPGLWNAPGYPELTTAQMVQVARQTEEARAAEFGGRDGGSI